MIIIDKMHRAEILLQVASFEIMKSKMTIFRVQSSRNCEYRAVRAVRAVRADLIMITSTAVICQQLSKQVGSSLESPHLKT